MGMYADRNIYSVGLNVILEMFSLAPKGTSTVYMCVELT